MKGRLFMSKKIGIVDIGSSTIRLVIYEKRLNRPTYERIENIKVTARLRSYLDEQNALKEEGIDRLLTTVQDFLKILKQYDVPLVTWVATASLRLAMNGKEIVDRVKEETGVQIRLLSDYEEAYYGYLAIRHSIALTEAITIDIGGGSTEVTYFREGEIVEYVSLPYGALSLRLQFISGDMATKEERDKMEQMIRHSLSTLPWLYDRQVPIIAIGGSVRNIARLHQQMESYPLDELHQYEMTAYDLQHVDEAIAQHTLQELQKLEAIDKERADTLQPAMTVFRSLCDIVGDAPFIISGQGLRDGLLYEMQGKSIPKMDEMIHESIDELKSRFYIGNQKEPQLQRLAEFFLKGIQQQRQCFTARDEELIRYGSRIFNLGKKADAETSNITFFLVSHYTFLGLSHKDRIRLALLSSFKNRRLFWQYVKPFEHWYNEEELKRLAMLGAILKVAQTLDRTKQESVKNVSIEKQTDEEWIVRIQHRDFVFSEQYHFNAQKKHLERALKVTLTPVFEQIDK